MAPTLVAINSFQYGLFTQKPAGSGFNGPFDSVTGAANVTFDTTEKRTTFHAGSLKYTGAASVVQAYRLRSGALAVYSLYFKLGTLPAVTTRAMFIGGANSNSEFRVKADGHLEGQYITGSAVASSGAYNDSAWHRLDVRQNCTAGTTDWQIDGTAQTQLTGTAGGATDATVVGGGTATEAGYVFWLSDLVTSDTSGDYPIGDHFCGLLVPDGDGTHSLGGVVSGDAGETTNLFQKVDEAPPDTTTFLRQTGTGASSYAQVTYPGPPAQTIWDVTLAEIGFSAGDGTLASNATTIVYDSEGQRLTTGSIDHSSGSAALGMRYGMLSRPTGGWDATKLGSVYAEWGRSTDVTENPRASALYIEYAAVLDTLVLPLRTVASPMRW
jgi:hypothetical protein